jgi:hypothetical protein
MRPPADCALRVDDELWPADPAERHKGLVVVEPAASIRVLVPPRPPAGDE